MQFLTKLSVVILALLNQINCRCMNLIVVHFVPHVLLPLAMMDIEGNSYPSDPFPEENINNSLMQMRPARPDRKSLPGK